MQDIAAEAGVNQALLHYYFRSKERLSEAVFRARPAELLPAGHRGDGLRAVDSKTRSRAWSTSSSTTCSRAPYLPGYIISELHASSRARRAS